MQMNWHEYIFITHCGAYKETRFTNQQLMLTPLLPCKAVQPLELRGEGCEGAPPLCPILDTVISAGEKTHWS